MTFQEKGFEIVRGAISRQTAKLLNLQIRIIIDQMNYYSKINNTELTTQGDRMVDNCLSWYGLVCFDSLMLLLQDKVEEVTNKKLYPTYTYSRMYYTDNILRKHKDRESCQYSVTITIDSPDEPWPIYIEGYDGKVTSAILEPGDMLVYRGDHLAHWREPYKGTEQLQAFCHYVDVDGPFKHRKWDSRPVLGTPTTEEVSKEYSGECDWLDEK